MMHNENEWQVLRNSHSNPGNRGVILSKKCPPLKGVNILDGNSLMIDNVHNKLARRTKVPKHGTN